MLETCQKEIVSEGEATRVLSVFCQTCYGKLRQLCKKIFFLYAAFQSPQPMPPSDPAKMHLCGVKGAKKETLRKKGGREGRWPRKQKKVGQNNSSRKSRQGGGEGGKQAAERLIATLSCGSIYLYIQFAPDSRNKKSGGWSRSPDNSGGPQM